MGLFGNLFKKKKNEEPIKNVNTEVTGSDIIIAGKMIKEGEEPKEDPSVYYVLLGNKISGLKGVSFDTRMLLINDHSLNNLTINYENNGEVIQYIINRSKIQSVNFISRVQMNTNGTNSNYENIDKHLLAEAKFGGYPLLQCLGEDSKYNNSVLDEPSRVDINTYYEFTVSFINEENEIQNIVFKVENNPEKFVNFLKNNIGNKQ